MPVRKPSQRSEDQTSREVPAEADYKMAESMMPQRDPVRWKKEIRNLKLIQYASLGTENS